MSVSIRSKNVRHLLQNVRKLRVTNKQIKRHNKQAHKYAKAVQDSHCRWMDLGYYYFYARCIWDSEVHGICNNKDSCCDCGSYDGCPIR